MSHEHVQVAGFLDNSLVNGKGMRSVLFVSGCRHGCPGCHNKAAQDFCYGDKVHVDRIFNRIEDNVPLISGVTFSGGEPFEQAEVLATLARRIKNELKLDIWCYSGYVFEEISARSKENSSIRELLECVDVLVDGKFEIENKRDGLKYRGSSNQRVVDVKRSLENGKTEIMDVD